MTAPSLSTTIDPTVSKWLCDWSDLSDWELYNGNTYFITANIGSDAAIGSYFNGPAGGSPSRRWDRKQPITARLRLKRFSAGWIGFSIFAGEAEYVGFSINSGGTVQYYCNAAYYAPANSYTATNGKAVELQIEFDGNQTYVFKARDYDPTDQAAWTLIGTKTFLPKVHPTIQINHEGGLGKAWYGTVEVTGSPVWQTSDVADRAFWLPVATHYALEWGIEFELANATDRGVQHFLTHAGGHTIQAVTDRYNNGGTATWDQTNLSTVYSTGTFFYQSRSINPAAGFKYHTLELIGGLRSGGVGSSLSVSLRKLDGSLVPSADLKGADNPVVFTSVLAEVKTLDLRDIDYAGLYFEIDGNSPNSTTHTSPTTATNEGLTGPPILKQAAITFIAPPVAASIVGGTYYAAQTVALVLSDLFAGGSIYYTLDGSTPTTASTLYTAPISIAESVTLKALAVDAEGNPGEVQTFEYVIVPLLAYSSLPYTVYDSLTQTATIHYSTAATGIWQEQRRQAAATLGSVGYPAVMAPSQKNQTAAVTASIKIGAATAGAQKTQAEAVPATVKASAVITSSQPKQSAAVATTVRYSAAAAQGQKAQTESSSAQSGASTAILRFIAPNPPVMDANGVIHYATEEIVYGYACDVEQMQPLQQAVIAAGLEFGASVDQPQSKQSQAAAAGVLVSGQIAQGQAAQLQEMAARYLAPGEALVEQGQGRQSAASFAEVLFAGVVDGAQMLQYSAQGHQEVVDLIISARDPLSLRIVARDPLDLKMLVRDPLRLTITAS